MASTPKRSTTRRPRERKAEPVQDASDPDTRWWVIVAPAESPTVEAGRYGFWRNRPNREYLSTNDGDPQVCEISGDEDEPNLVVVLRDTLTISFVQVAHLSAVPVIPERTEPS